MSQKPRKKPHPGQALTKREQQVYDLVKTGLANKEIAYRLEITENAVKVNLVQIFRKVGVSNRTELAMRYTRSMVC